MAIVCDDNDHIFVPCVIWACVYCLWSDRYILIDSSHVIIVCDHCFWCEIMDWSFWAHALFPKITLLNTLLVCDHSWFPLFFDFWVQLCALLFFQLRVMHAKLKSKYNKGHCFLAFQVHLILGLFLMRCWRRRITYVKLFSFTFFLYFVFVTSFLQTLICFFAEQKYSYAAPASSPSAWSPQQEVCSTILFLFPLFFFLANGMQVWIQLYVLTCEYQLYSPLNFHSEIYVLAFCSIKILHVFGWEILYYPAAAFNFLNILCCSSQLSESDLILALSRKESWQKSFFLSDVILVRTATLPIS